MATNLDCTLEVLRGLRKIQGVVAAGRDCPNDAALALVVTIGELVKMVTRLGYYLDALRQGHSLGADDTMEMDLSLTIARSMIAALEEGQ